MSFSNMKGGASAMAGLLKDKLQESNTTYNSDDDLYWGPTRDTAGNAFAVIRFLPQAEGEEVPWIEEFSHGFQSPTTNRWFIEPCLTTIGQKCPVCEDNSRAWKSGDQDLARARKRRLKYVSSIMVIDDQSYPENNGKVYLYRYGKKIFEKIEEAINPSFKDESPINPFDFWAGADFKVKVSMVSGYPNYDKSSFDTPSVLGGFSDDELEAIWKQQLKLQDFIAQDKFKSYQELQTKFHEIWNGEEATASFSAEETVIAPKPTFAAPSFPKKEEPVVEEVQEEPMIAPIAPVVAAPVVTPAPANEEIDSLEEFRRLALGN